MGTIDELHDLACDSDRTINHYYPVSLEVWDFAQESLRYNDGPRIVELLQ